MAKGKTAGVLSKPNLIKTAVGVTATLFVLAKIQKETDPTSWVYKFGKMVGLKA